jgi:hypothetical protein
VRVDGSIAVGASPRPLWGVSPTFEADAPTGGSLSPTFHLGFDRASTGSVDLGGPTAAFTSTLGIAEGCPNRWTLGAWSFEPCARVEAGILQGQGDHVVEPRTDTHSWLAVGAVARAEWAAFRPIFVDFEGGFRVPVVRTTFFFEPYNVIYETAPVGGLIRAGLGVRFL